jgi:hypothetical protein
MDGGGTGVIFRMVKRRRSDHRIREETCMEFDAVHLLKRAGGSPY